MPTLGFLKKKKKEKPSLHVRTVSSQTAAADLQNPSEPPTPTTVTSTTTAHSFGQSSTARSSTSATPHPPHFASQTVSEPMALVSERPIMPDQQHHEQQQQQQFQAPASPIPQQQQPHQSNINSIINPPQPDQYDGAGSNATAQNSAVAQAQAVGSSVETNTQGDVQQQQQQQQKATARSTKGKYALTDFSIQRTLGTGSFGRVHLVQSRHNLRFYAIKVLKKGQVVKMKQVEHTNDERRMLQKVKHPFLITLWGTFQDNRNLYMVMDFIEGGELFSLLRKSQVISNL